jgi:drug/metabolite transporter (DMT)-like permease
MSLPVAAGVLLALLTSVSWALGNVYIQKSGRLVGASRAMLWALLAGGAAAGVLSLLLDVRQAPITPAVIGWIVLAGLSGLLAYACLFASFARAPLSLAVPLVSSWSIISGALSFLVFGERLRAGPLAGAVVVLSGVILVSLGAMRESPVSAAGPRSSLWVSFGSAVGFGIMVPSLTHVAPATGEFGATALVYGIGLLLGLPLARALGIELRPPPRAAWPLVLVTGCFETLGFVAISFARRYAPMAVVTPVSSLAAALTVLYAWVVLRERPHPLATAGAVLACVGVVILAM